MAYAFTTNFMVNFDLDSKLKASTAVTDRNDYGGIGPDEFESRVKAEDDRLYGDVFAGAVWEQVGKALF